MYLMRTGIPRQPDSATGTESSAASATGAKTGSGSACWPPWPTHRRTWRRCTWTPPTYATKSVRTGLRHQVAHPGRGHRARLATHQAKPLLEGLHPSHVLADRAYAADPLRDFIIEQGVEPVIPGRHHRKVPIEHDRQHNVVERSIDRFTQCHRPATRFEKTVSSYLAPLMFLAVRHWPRNPFAR